MQEAVGTLHSRPPEASSSAQRFSSCLSTGTWPRPGDAEMKAPKPRTEMPPGQQSQEAETMNCEESSADTSCVPPSACNSGACRVIMPSAGCGWIACPQSSLLTASAYGLGWETSEAHFQGKGRLFFAQSPETACISPRHASVHDMHQSTAACISPRHASAHKQLAGLCEDRLYTECLEVHILTFLFTSPCLPALEMALKL